MHHDGQMWSCALWGIRAALGHGKADTVILDGQSAFTGITITQLAHVTVPAA